MSGNRMDPYGSFGFKVVVTVGGGESIGYFQEVSGLSVQIEVQDVEEGGLNVTTRKVIGKASYSNITLKRGLCNKSMFEWIDRFVHRSGTVERLSGTISILNDAGSVVKEYSFTRGIPVKWDGPSLSVSQDAIATESLEIAHEGLTSK